MFLCWYNGIYLNIIWPLFKVCLLIRIYLASLVCNHFYLSLAMTLFYFIFYFLAFFYDQNWKFLYCIEHYSFHSFVRNHFINRSLWFRAIFFYGESKSIFCNYLGLSLIYYFILIRTLFDLLDSNKFFRSFDNVVVFSHTESIVCCCNFLLQHITIDMLYTK